MIGFGFGPGGSGAGNLLRVKKDLRMTRPSRPTMALTSRDMIQRSVGVLVLMGTARLGPLDGDALISMECRRTLVSARYIAFHMLRGQEGVVHTLVLLISAV